MMFTAQQLQGGQRYNPKVRIGNWSEDVDLEQLRLKNYLSLRQTGDLAVHRTQQKFAKSLTKVGHTYSHDGRLHFGDKVMLLNKQTNGTLVCDMGDVIAGTSDAFAVTSSPDTQSAVARAMFTIVRVDPNDGFPGNDLHYGQSVRFQVHSFLSPRPLYLHSCAVSHQHYARFSRYQEVSVWPVAEANTIWVAEHVDPKARFEHNGVPIPANAPLILKHSLTGQWLASDRTPYRNDFGNEFEVSCHSFLVAKKTQQLGSEKQGKVTIDIPSRQQENQNIWMIVTASDPTQERENLPQDAELSVGQVLLQIKEKLQERGPFGVRAMMKGLRNLDELQAKKLNHDDFKWGLINYGVVLEDDSLYKLIRRYDPNSEGLINYEEFFTELKGSMNERRVRLVSLAYQKLDVKGDGQVSLDYIAQQYDAANNPYVRKGRIPEDMAFKEFMAMWDTAEPQALVSLQEFARFYEDLSAGVATDEAFESLIRGAWHV